MRDVPTHILVHVTAPAEPGADPSYVRVAQLRTSPVDGGLSGDIPQGVSLTGRIEIIPFNIEEGET